ncbi:glycine zipper 2TM domain-containing protein [Caulobacter segnis]|uniref:glycine zipper 2TM domain-containing protein n=1 Tax=Caulobacter segnis TaxID=88688 RepID=UPI00240FC615|nr:glycine zipper 2TM domain-containing protein [Caulobacter segnis]MDG2520759.1 glycine zipper 2TM domain-containing protein [Caulobacter segnis]
MRAIAVVLLSAAALTSLSACASNGYGGRYASYEDRCRGERANQRAAGTVAGAALGALAGSAIAGNSSNTAGTIAGGVVGGVVGNQVAKGDPCPGDYYR